MPTPSKSACEVHVTLDKPRVMSPEIEAFQLEIARSLSRPDGEKAEPIRVKPSPTPTTATCRR